MADLAGRRAGRRWKTAHERGQEQPERHAAGRRDQPVLANLYMNRFLKFWRLKECGKTFRAHVVNYADDFVILSCGHAAEALAWMKA